MGVGVVKVDDDFTIEGFVRVDDNVGVGKGNSGVFGVKTVKRGG